MSDQDRPASREDFLKGADAWLKCDTRAWQKYWLAAPGCLLKHAPDTGCRFDAEVLKKLDELEALETTGHEQVAGQLYSEFLAAEDWLTEQRRQQRKRAVLSQAASLMKGMIHGVRAAMAFPRDGTAPSDECLCRAVDCCKAYQEAWPLGIGASEPVAKQGKLQSSATFEQNKDRVANALQEVVRRGLFPDLSAAAWLTVRRLLAYLLAGDDPLKDKPVRAPVLGYLPDAKAQEESEGEGAVCDVRVYRQEEGHYGAYLDPVAMGLTQVDQSMITSLDLAWRACHPELQGLVNRRVFHALPAIRLAPDLPQATGGSKGVWEFSGGSAGGLFACAMYAAATDTPLNTDASASVALRLDDSQLDDGKPSQEDLEPAKIPVDTTADQHVDVNQVEIDDVSYRSIGPKLKAAKDRGIRRVVLTNKQEQWAKKHKGEVVHREVEVVGAANLAEVYRALTGDARIERVLEEYCRRQVQQWEKARRDPHDPDKLVHYIEPHYSLLKEGRHPFDASSRFGEESRGEGQEPEDPYLPVAQGNDSPEAELTKLLSAGRLLCITEDAGAGKSIFTRRLSAFLCSDAGREAIFDGRPCLAVRWEEWTRQWPEDFPAALAAAVEPAVRAAGGDVSPQHVADWALENGRVVIILDALDQVSDNSRVKSLGQFLNHPNSSQCRVVLTSRSFAVSERQNTLFHTAGWRFGRIDGFDRRQQEEYLRGLFRAELDELFPNYEDVKKLLRIPVVLSMVRGLKEQGQRAEFRTRAELYFQSSYLMIGRAAAMLRERFDESMVLDLEEILAAVAFQMMSDETYDYAVRGPNRVRAVREAAGRRCGVAVTADHWEMVREATGLTNRCILEGSTTQALGFKHRGMMEFYCGMHLARNRQAGWVRSPGYSGGSAPITCGDPAVARFANDPNWRWAFRFAAEMPWEVWENTPEVLCASLAPLFERPAQGRRPTELIYRAWHLFEVDRLVLREMGLTPEQGRALILPGAQQVLAHYRRREGPGAELIRAITGGLGPWGRFRQALGDLTARGVLKLFSPAAWREALRRPLVRCPPAGSAAEFPMGSPEGEGESGERPQHTVTLAAFEMQAAPVTRAEYRVFDPELERERAEDFEQYSPEENCPAIDVSWYDAFAFAKWLGADYRLPTEAQWEYACRAGSTTAYCFGDSQSELGEYAWYSDNSEGKTHPVGEKEPNAWGLYDMHGNVWERCWDWYSSDYYAESASSDPAGPDTGSDRVDRGGSWGGGAGFCRCANRGHDWPGFGSDFLGFRVSRVLADESGAGAQPEA